MLLVINTGRPLLPGAVIVNAQVAAQHVYRVLLCVPPGASACAEVAMDNFVEDEGYMLGIVEEITHMVSQIVAVSIRRPEIYTRSVIVNRFPAFIRASKVISA